MIDTRSFMIAAYTVATAIYLAYFASLWARARRVREKILIQSEAKDRRPGASNSSRRSE
jgi:hypothetical protein